MSDPGTLDNVEEGFICKCGDPDLGGSHSAGGCSREQ